MKDIIQRKLDQYHCIDENEEENALKEITQDVVLYSLSKCDFFENASFQEGTCLRIIHGLDRFSEDLDFALNSHNLDFDIQPYLEKTASLLKAYGYAMEISGKDKINSTVKGRFLKDDSIKKLLTLSHLSDLRRKISIKVEVDTNPPEGAKLEIKYLDFPTDFSIFVHDLSSLFAGKLHALLCRNYVKGRDWYDFSWYVSQKIYPNYALLQNALKQQGPWKLQDITINHQWLFEKMSAQIEQLDWKTVIQDVAPFLKPEKHKEVQTLWSRDYFISKVQKIPKQAAKQTE